MWCHIVDTTPMTYLMGLYCAPTLDILFDEGLLAIEPDSLSVQLAPTIKLNRHYGDLEGAVLHQGSRSSIPTSSGS